MGDEFLESILSNEWDEYADSWDIDPSVEDYAKKTFLALVNNISINGLTVLDFGCGTGALTKLISPNVDSIVAIDPSSAMIKCLDKKALNNVLSVSDYLSEDLIRKRPELKGQFDLIVASSVCSFLPDYETTLSLLKSLLKENGVFVQWDWQSSDDSSEMGLSPKRVKQAFEANNFVNTTITSPFIMSSSKGDMPVLMAIGKNAVQGTKRA
ncbi:class I SAM-dependent methyltransferase [Marinomonas sp. RSW2]|uniref:Class I SAM-dependent methyltransferase n=1 Tax=Marinomonas maritima TaxID=2940935 RepID=A0ABT5WIL6_9GAMM|nr:class I SAM-dependent methyltransferase [Marinomonas maritima]MDE8604259.1 class I SAM-dependent methyltransferase [Marinomonas maritima]